MKKMLFAIFTLIVFLGFVSSFDIPEYYDFYVNDFGAVLNTEDVETLTNIFTLVEENSSVQIVFVSFDTIGEDEISNVAFTIGERWGVGQKDADNGVVILYVEDLGKIFVATGYGVEGVLPDSKIGRMLDEVYIPLREEGNVNKGIIEFSFLIAEELIKNGESLSFNSSRNNYKIFVFIFIIILFIIILSVYFPANRRRPIFIPTHNSRFGRSFGRSFGGGSFGGGGSGR